MLDLTHLPSGADVQMFLGHTTTTNIQWQTWRKPRGKAMGFIVCVGSGSGGGAGFTKAGAGAGGGGGGASGAIQTCLYSLYCLPDVLHVQVGLGGVGGKTSGTAGANGVISAVCVGGYATNLANNAVAASGGNPPTGGAAGTASSANNGGAAGAVASTPQFGQLCFNSQLAGQAGGNGGVGTGNNQPAAVAIPATGLWVSGGIGGASCNSGNAAGRTYTVVADSIISECAATAPAAGSNSGSGGYMLRPPTYPLWSYGGLGGASNNTGVGGDGGNAGPGSGGGGGGGGTTGGAGGDGGPGLVIIISF